VTIDEYTESDLAHYTRDEFASERFDYKPGQHVVFGGPTGRGKTEEAFSLLKHVASPSLPAYVAVSKPSDRVSQTRGLQLGYRRVTSWPPQTKVSEMKMFGGGPPSGYLIWPILGANIDTDNETAARVTGDLLKHTYAGGAKGKHAILVMDDTMVKAKILGLDGQMVTILAMAGAMGIGIWIFVQKPTDSGRTTVWGYEQATHLFFTKGGDARVLQRYAEIAGEYGPTVKRVIPTLRPFEFLYLQKYLGHMCIVGAQ
jgi:hypothetical protein